MTLSEHMQSVISQASDYNSRLKDFFDKEVLREFSMTSGKPFVPWLEFGTHKNVYYWYLVEGGYAVGHNENTGRGWSFPIKKLSSEQVAKYLKHTQTYDQYYNIQIN